MISVIAVYLALVGMVAALSTLDPDGLPWSKRWSVLLFGPLALLCPAFLVVGTLYIIGKVITHLGG